VTGGALPERPTPRRSPIGAFLFFLQGYLIQITAVSSPFVAETFGLGDRAVALLLAVGSLGMLGTALLGRLVDRFGRRRTLRAALLALPLPTVATALAESLQGMPGLARTEIVGPGYLNLFLQRTAFLRRVLGKQPPHGGGEHLHHIRLRGLAGPEALRVEGAHQQLLLLRGAQHREEERQRTGSRHRFL